MVVTTFYARCAHVSHHLVPTPTVSVTAPNTQIVGQSLMLECSVTTVRGITSRVDIVWSSDGMIIAMREGVSTSAIIDNSTVYINIYTILQLETADDDKTYKCGVIINRSTQISAAGNVTLNVIGT